MTDKKLPEGFSCDFDGLAEALLGEPEVSVRVNRGKNVGVPDGADAVPWCDSGYYLASRPAFTFDPAMHQGLYYVQDASSMITSWVVGRIAARIGRPVNYLDACAAPGGKTTAAIDSLPEGSVTVANEYVYARAEVLKETLAKWGAPRVIVTRGDTSRLARLGEVFDIITADVPCSGEGMFRKDAEARAQWSPRLVEECAALQREIIDNLWEALRPGGYMIYSTCTFNRRENEDMLRYMTDTLGAGHVEIDPPESWGITERDGCLHFLPGRTRGEGLTLTVVRKPGTLPEADRIPEKPSKAPAQVKDWVKIPADMELREADGRVTIVTRSPLLKAVEKRCDVISAGTEVAEIKGRDYIPRQGLAMSTLLNRGKFPEYEVDYTTAIACLRREAVTLGDAPHGYVLLTYRGEPLGWVKNIGNRANNLYPQAWRIMSSHVPDEAPQVL